MFKIVFLFLSIFIIGCGTPEKKIVIATDVPTYKLMYVKVDKSPFKKSEKIKVFSVVNGIAETPKGEISILDLEEKRSEFRLYVNTPNGERIRILNIKPKYTDDIWLKKGKYHIEVSAPKHIIYKEWIDVADDTNISVALKREVDISMGSISWEALKGVKYINGLFWQDQAINKINKLNWNEANNYCSKLVIKSNGLNIEDFELPTQTELLSLYKSNSSLDYSGTIYWSFSTDDKHTNFAKYVYINNKKNGWYNKKGTTYVRCVSRKNYPKKLSINKLAKRLMKDESYKYLDAFESAVHIKYGKPVIKNFIFSKDKKKLTFRLKSQKHDSDKKYFYDKKHSVNAKKESRRIIKNPKVKFEIINDKLIFKGIK